MWTYFLASGLAFAFLERREEVGQEIPAKIQCGLNAKMSPGISFEDGEITGSQFRFSAFTLSSFVPQARMRVNIRKRASGRS
jgi:hypothetical protein